MNFFVDAVRSDIIEDVNAIDLVEVDNEAL
jgi:hypothetical protein